MAAVLFCRPKIRWKCAAGGVRSISASLCATPRPADLADLFDAVEADPERRHVILSTGRNPYANLAVEQRLLERAHPDGRLLFMYRNYPCVVIGRNQNPWAEVALGRMRLATAATTTTARTTSSAIADSDSGVSSSSSSVPAARRPVSVPVANPLWTTPAPVLVRRRSGGGAVYHDAGNANWSVLGPAAGFDRDVHAWMVARALQRLGVASARVNARHDLVVGGYEEEGGSDNNSDSGGSSTAGSTAGSTDSNSSTGAPPRKVSGSAYKLTSRRALHHGTCLLGADLAAVSGLLRSPAAPYLKARGVASVRSPVQNVFGPRSSSTAMMSATAATMGMGMGTGTPRVVYDRFEAAVVAEFEAMYGAATHSVIDVDGAAAAHFAEDERLARGYRELMTPDWLFGQTPRFAFSTHATDDDPRARPPRPADVPPDFQLAFTARHGCLEDVQVAGLPGVHASVNAATAAALEAQLLYHIHDWTAALVAASGGALDPAAAAPVGAWLNRMFIVGE